MNEKEYAELLKRVEILELKSERDQEVLLGIFKALDTLESILDTFATHFSILDKEVEMLIERTGKF